MKSLGLLKLDGSFEDNNAVMEHLEKYRVPLLGYGSGRCINEPYFHSGGMVRNIGSCFRAPDYPRFPLGL